MMRDVLIDCTTVIVRVWAAQIDLRLHLRDPIETSIESKD